MLKEFLKFLKEYKVVGLAVAFIIGAASSSLIKSLVDDILMPLINPLIPSESWREATLQFGEISLRWGNFLAEVINFLIIALVVFVIAKKVFKEEQVAKK